MAAVIFDTQRFVARLKQGGVPEEQAQAFASALTGSADDCHGEPSHALDAKLAELRMELRIEMHDTNAEMIKWMAGLLLLQAGLVALVKLL